MSDKQRDKEDQSRDDLDKEELDKRAQNAIEEARMVLPGIQALFGFQLNRRLQPAFSADSGGPAAPALLCASARRRGDRADHGARRLSPHCRAAQRFAFFLFSSPRL